MSDEDIIWAECEICGMGIELEFYDKRGDMIVCHNCSAEYVIKSRHPACLTLLEDEY